MFQKNALSVFALFCAFFSYANEVKLEWQSYTSSPSAKEQSSDYALLKGDYKLDFTKGPFYFDSHFLWEYGLDRSKFAYFNVPELYLYYKYELKAPLYFVRSIQVSLGRKAQSWSQGDEYWDLGLWNPLTRWNPLHPSDSGLIGYFLTFTANQWESNFFAGAIHLPDQEVRTIKEGGRSYSHSRWFSILPEGVAPFPDKKQIILDLFYLRENPFIRDILLQQSFLFNLKTWSKTPEVFYWMKWSFANKPVNHLFYVSNTNNSLRVEEKEGGEVFVKPKFTVFPPVRQRILSTEWGLDYRDISITFSLENTKMKPASILSKDWSFLQEQADFTYFSALLKYNYLEDSFFRLAFIQSWFARSDFSQRAPSIVGRGKILEGMGVEWQTQLFSHTNQPLFFNLKYQYSFLDEGAWFSAKAVYYMTSKIYTELTADVLGAFEPSKNNSFLKRFKHNDYFTWSVAYDF
ncbi:MAG: hypothetical protein OXJ52_06840 [Oligoflexia bacterium]|nr:hypothetical protein [Oligoflexia bacterium]